MPSQKFATMLLNTLRPKQNVRHFADTIFKCIFLNEKAEISIKIALQFIPKDSINKIQLVSDNALALTSQQAIIWNNDTYMYHLASLS